MRLWRMNLTLEETMMTQSAGILARRVASAEGPIISDARVAATRGR